MTEGEEQSRDVPSKTQLAERMARVEEGLNHIETKIDHHGQTLERIEESLDDQTDQNAAAIEEMSSQHRQLWFLYQGVKWALMLLCSGSLLLILFDALIV